MLALTQHATLILQAEAALTHISGRLGHVGMSSFAVTTSDPTMALCHRHSQPNSQVRKQAPESLSQVGPEAGLSGGYTAP